MERLTKWNEQTEQAELLSWDEKEWKDFMGSLDVPIATELSIAINKLAEYEYLEEQGLLLKFPCKVGGVVYTNMRASGWYKREKEKPYKATVAFIGINGKDNFMNVVFENGNMLQFLFSDIGKTVFLTKEEAEAALERMGKDEFNAMQ